MNIDEIKTEEDAMEQYGALTHIVMDMLEAKKKESKMFFVALIISLIMNVVIVGIFLWYESTWDYTTTETTTQEVSGHDSDINNVDGDQYKDSAVHNEGSGN